MTWSGYNVHLTERCDEDTPHVTTDVLTTPAPLSEFDMTSHIQARLAERALLPHEHLLDMGSGTAEHLVRSQSQYQGDLVGPGAPDPSWQALSQTRWTSSRERVNDEDNEPEEVHCGRCCLYQKRSEITSISH